MNHAIFILVSLKPVPSANPSFQPVRQGGKLGLDAPVVQYLPYFQMGDEHHRADHRSTVGDTPPGTF